MNVKSVTIGLYTITEYRDDPVSDYCVSHEDGESMGVSYHQLMDMFAEFFEEHM